MQVTHPHLFLQWEAADISLFVNFPHSMKVFRNLLSLRSLSFCPVRWKSLHLLGRMKA